MLDRAIAIFRRMGFALAEGPDVETEWYCFDALNTAPDHPARNEQDTFYLPDGRLLRTHTSTVQIRTMQSAPPPIRVIAPGAAYRRDEVDATHSAQFHQIEGLYVDENVTVGDLKGTIEFFLRELLGPKTEIRFRPHFFPFTEPSFECDVKSKALKSGEKWIELAGCGMVHPAVFEEVNRSRGDAAYDPEKYSGFAFGMGMDRLAMILFDIPDIRLFVQNDLRFLRQFAMKFSVNLAARIRRASRNSTSIALGSETCSTRSPGSRSKESSERARLDLDHVVVAQINASAQHPNADRLSVCDVDDGTNHHRQIVCGAKNYKVGDKVPVALPGAALPNGLKIKVSTLRGVESQGMLCSPSELKMSEESDGLLILSPDATVGAPIGSLFPPDTILDVEITPNRGDLLSYLGLAREIAALSAKQARMPQIAEPKTASDPERQNHGAPRMSLLFRAPDRKHHGRAKSGLAARETGSERPASDQQPRGHHQLRDAGIGAAIARFRCGETAGRHHRPPRPRTENNFSPWMERTTR